MIAVSIAEKQAEDDSVEVRQIYDEQEKKTLQRKRQNTAQEYKSRKGNLVPVKDFKNINCNCPNKCNANMN